MGSMFIKKHEMNLNIWNLFYFQLKELEQFKLIVYLQWKESPILPSPPRPPRPGSPTHPGARNPGALGGGGLGVGDSFHWE